MTIQELLGTAIKYNASDLHLLVGVTPMYRIDSFLTPLVRYPVLTSQDITEMVYSLLTPEQKELLVTNKELDFGMTFGEEKAELTGRFRVNAYFEKGTLAADFRFLPKQIKTIQELRLPKIVYNFTKMRQGLVLVAGPTGHGKSTTLAGIINEINMNYAYHILTIEDPIEYIYPTGKSIISQREVGIDTHSWAMALRAALREDPDVVLLGEMRDAETMAAAMTVAETGHLIFSTLHTNSASQSIDRIVDSFPPHQQTQIRTQLAAVLQGIISQRLVPRIDGGRVPVAEILIANAAVASNIRDGKTHLIDSIIQTSQEAGMVTLENSLAALVLSGDISLETAKQYAIHQDELARLVG